MFRTASCRCVFPSIGLLLVSAAPLLAQNSNESFTTMPSWSSSQDAGWGGAATWSIVGGGQSGNALQISRNNAGSSAKARVYTVAANTPYSISVYVKCPSSGVSYWAETAYRLGSHTAADFNDNVGAWTMIKKFANDGTNGNGNAWTQYTLNFNSGSSTQISVGFKLGSAASNPPAVLFDTLAITATGPPSGGNLVSNPSFESGFSGGLASSWSSWTAAGTGYWKQSALLGRIGPGVYGLGGNPLPAVNRYYPKTVLLFEDGLSLAASVRSASPDAIIIGREWNDPDMGTYLTNPEYYGVQYADYIHGLAVTYPQVDAWQGLNEPPASSAQFDEVGRFEKAFTDRLHTYGDKSIVLNLAVGNPGDMSLMVLPEIVDCLEVADYVGYHSYGSDADELMTGPDNPWYAHRWRMYANTYATNGYRMPPVIYTEATTWSGWKGYFSAAAIRDDLILFEQQSRQDPWAVGITLFICGDNGGWYGWQTADEPTIYQGCGDWNAAHPADAADGLYSQQWGLTSGSFAGGIRQAVAVTASTTYELSHSAKYETSGANTVVSYKVGYDLTGQTSNGNAGTIVWSSDLNASEARNTDMWYDHSTQFTATGSTVSIWFRGERLSGSYSWRAMVDDVVLESISAPSNPTIALAPSTLTPSCTQGTNAANQNFTIQNVGAGTLSYSISDNATWLSCSPTSGTSTGEVDSITVSYTTSGLAVGTYNATITVTASGATNTPQTIPVNLTVNASKITVAEDFNTQPSWSSTFDAGWGGAAAWSVVGGGQSGNALQATRSNTGSSAKAKVYTISPNSSYTIKVYARCPSSGDAYWRECFYKLGTYTAQDFDQNGGTWTEIKKFSNSGTNGNGNTWVQYTKTFNSGSSTQISVGFKTGNSGGTAPTIQWDTLRIA